MSTGGSSHHGKMKKLCEKRCLEKSLTLNFPRKDVFHVREHMYFGMEV